MLILSRRSPFEVSLWKAASYAISTRLRFLTIRVAILALNNFHKLARAAGPKGQSRIRDMPQISRGKFDCLRCATAGFTTSALDGYGLRNHMLARPPP